MAILDLFAGTGVGVACQNLGVSEVGVEIQPDVVESRTLNGLVTPYLDAWDVAAFEQLGPSNFAGIWASPPCQTFSLAGTGSGRRALDTVVEAIEEGLYKEVQSLRKLGEKVGDERTGLVLLPLHYVYKFKPRFTIWEQVTSVLPVWEKAARELETQLGYDTWAGVVDAADYGVPQYRKRAYLIARNDGGKVAPPEPSVGEPVTMFEATGWGFTDRPAPTVTGHVTATRSPSGTQNVFREAIRRGEFKFKPGHSPKRSRVATKGLGSEFPPDAVNYDEREALLLQGYPEDFKLVGTKTQRQQHVGNAVPPPVAEALIGMMYE